VRERRLAALAERQHGVVARRQLLAAGLSIRTIERRIESRRLWIVHRGVYASGHAKLSLRGGWMAAVLAYGEGALLSHRSAAALWGLMRPRGSADVTAGHGTGRHGRRGIAVHVARLGEADRAVVEGIPATTVARTLFDLAEAVDEVRLERALEEADRLGLLELRQLREVCDRSPGRRALRPVRRLIDAAREPERVRSPLEQRFADFCRACGLPPPVTNVEILGSEVDAFWPAQRVIVEVDGFGFHRHRAAFERDRARDAARQAAGYRVVRLTHRRLQREAGVVAGELRRLLPVGGEGSGAAT